LCQEYEYPRFDVCALAQRVLGVPVFATFQGGMAPRTAFEQRFRRRAMHAGAAYAVGSAAEAQRIRERYGVPAAKVHHIPNPLDVAVWHQGDRARGRAAIGVPDDALVVAWHGRVDIHHKGLDVLLHAWSLLARRTDLPPLRLLLVGPGPDSPEVRRRLDAARVEGVTWFDEYVLDKRRLADLLAAGDVYAFPSRREGFPVAPLEAMAAGLPVVAADAPGVAEILPGGEASGGVVVPREDGPALAEALAQLLLDAPRRETMARRARAHVEAVFSLDAVGRALARMLSGPPA
jgi:starch synthase